MPAIILIPAAAVVFALTLFLLKVSGAGRELFGRDSWMLRVRHGNDDSARSSGSFIEHHAFWSLDPDAERDFWDDVPEDDEDDEGDTGIAAISGDR